MADSLDKRLQKIESRNKSVDLNKSWETSLTRRTAIATLTYIVAVIFMIKIDIDDPYFSALVPAGGYLLSTLSLRILRKRWEKMQ